MRYNYSTPHSYFKHYTGYHGQYWYPYRFAYYPGNVDARLGGRWGSGANFSYAYKPSWQHRLAHYH